MQEPELSCSIIDTAKCAVIDLFERGNITLETHASLCDALEKVRESNIAIREYARIRAKRERVLSDELESLHETVVELTAELTHYKNQVINLNKQYTPQ